MNRTVRISNSKLTMFDLEPFHVIPTHYFNTLTIALLPCIFSSLPILLIILLILPPLSCDFFNSSHITHYFWKIFPKPLECHFHQDWHGISKYFSPPYVVFFSSFLRHHRRYDRRYDRDVEWGPSAMVSRRHGGRVPSSLGNKKFSWEMRASAREEA